MAYRSLIAGIGLALFLAAHSAAFIFSLQARTFYYVSSGGNDVWDGQSPVYAGGSAGPWKTLNRACKTVFKPGDILFLHRGDVFQGRALLRGSGDPGNPCSVMPYGDGSRPVIESPDEGISFEAAGWQTQGLEFRNCLYGIVLHWLGKTEWDGFTFNDLYMHDIKYNAIHWDTTGFTNLTQTVFRNLEIRNCLFENNQKAWGTYVPVSNADRCTINNLRFINCTCIRNGYDAISLQFTTGGEISNCRFEDNGSTNHASSSLLLQNTDFCIVRDTVITGTRRYGDLPDGQGIDFEGNCRNCTVDNVQISECDGAAIMFFLTHGSSQNLEIQNCTFSNNCLNPYPGQGSNELLFYVNSTGTIHDNTWYHRAEVNFTGGPGSTNGFTFYNNSGIIIP
jgi:hypothetical protein